MAWISMAEGDQVIAFALMVREMLADVRPGPQGEDADYRVKTASILRDLGFDAVAAYDLADRTVSATRTLAGRAVALREAADALLAIAEEAEDKAERIERRKR